ncbi:probable methyltransferase-like protein 24 [Myxocyprinus asiaticus]|uniref:probable methyltransferase-like protein 24 n=1 Tax=Myxocyprinus asiaticus TaxID=70543 RepID=UPI002222728C|nr:probable methyltransferase-like protein 24 [Myxocyprinus asiaticus]
MNKCLLLRLCVLLSLLCVYAYVYMEFNGFWLKVWRKRPIRPQKQQLHHMAVPTATDVLADVGSTCCPRVKHQRRIPRWKIDLEPWATETHSLEEEANRFLKYITTPKVSCKSPLSGPPVFDREHHGSWVLCLDGRFSLIQRIISKHCRVYSLRLGLEDDHLERVLAGSGCEVHCFDPSIRAAHLQDSHMWLHRLSVDWRDPNPAVPAQRLHSNTKKLATILNDFGHRQVDVLKVDMESAEWKILENLILEEVLDSIGLLLLEVHLHWAGFEVGGDEPSVVRYWFSLLRELERAHFRLYHSYSDPTKTRLFLHKNLQNASSSYILGWVNTQFSPQW